MFFSAEKYLKPNESESSVFRFGDFREQGLNVTYLTNSHVEGWSWEWAEAGLTFRIVFRTWGQTLMNEGEQLFLMESS